MDKLTNLITLGFARGYRTFLCVSVIITLALAQKYLGLQIDQPTWLILIGILAACLRAAIGNAAAVLLLCLSLSSTAFAADTNSTPRLYATAGVELEAHHGALAGASDYGSILHVGADYGLLGVEGVLTGPLDRSQVHVRRSAGIDLIVSPLSGYLVQPFLSAGAGYYYGTTRYDNYATWAADIGGGLRLPISDHVFLQACGRVMLPFDTTSNVFQLHNRFQMLSLEFGVRY